MEFDNRPAFDAPVFETRLLIAVVANFSEVMAGEVDDVGQVLVAQLAHADFDVLLVLVEHLIHAALLAFSRFHQLLQPAQLFKSFLSRMLHFAHLRLITSLRMLSRFVCF